jgi:hypothetical protein
VKSLTKKHHKALKEEHHTKVVFQELDSLIDKPTREEWSRQESLAITKRGDYLKIYDVQIHKGCLSMNIFLLRLILL